MNAERKEPRRQGVVVQKMRSSTTVNTTRLKNASYFGEVRFRLLNVFDDPIGYAGIESGRRERKTNAVKDVRFGQCRVALNLRTNIGADNGSELSEMLCSAVRATGSNLQNFATCHNLLGKRAVKFSSSIYEVRPGVVIPRKQMVSSHGNASYRYILLKGGFGTLAPKEIPCSPTYSYWPR